MSSKSSAARMTLRLKFTRCRSSLHAMHCLSMSHSMRVRTAPTQILSSWHYDCCVSMESEMLLKKKYPNFCRSASNKIRKSRTHSRKSVGVLRRHHRDCEQCPVLGSSMKIRRAAAAECLSCPKSFMLRACFLLLYFEKCVHGKCFNVSLVKTSLWISNWVCNQITHQVSRILRQTPGLCATGAPGQAYWHSVAAMAHYQCPVDCRRRLS